MTNNSPKEYQDYGHPKDPPEEELLAQTEKIGNDSENPKSAPDVVTDPALNVRQGSDWSSEGGAT